MRTLTVLFRRDADRDRQAGPVRMNGYRMFWPDGREAAVGLNAFCRHGERVLSLDRHLVYQPERLIDILCYPVGDLGERMTRLPGMRVRRFALHRTGPTGSTSSTGRRRKSTSSSAGTNSGC